MAHLWTDFQSCSNTVILDSKVVIFILMRMILEGDNLDNDDNDDDNEFEEHPPR